MSKTMLDTAQQRMSMFAQEEPSCVCFNVRKAARAVTQLDDERMWPFGLRVTPLAILGQTLLLEPMTVTHLAEVAVTDRTTLTRNLRLPEQRGLIRIDRGEDRRGRAVRLTDRGRDILAHVSPIWNEVQAQVAARFGSERFARLLSDLSALVEVARPREFFLDISVYLHVFGCRDTLLAASER
jgi:DNA-binding MarR family transcriptional regulator